MRIKDTGTIGALSIISILIAVSLSTSVLGKRFDRVLSDRITDTIQRNDVVVVGIDDSSLQKIGAWPWKRDVFSRVVDTLYKHGARLVVFDILFLEERDGDDDMLRVLKERAQPVIYASKFDTSTSPLLSVYSTNKYALSGVAHVYPDDDGKVRHIQFSHKDAASTCHHSLSYQAFLTVTRQDPSSVCDTSNHYFVYQDTLPKTFSLIDIVEETIDPSYIAGKTVLIGSVSVDVEDHFISHTGEKIGGVYIHASALTSLLNNSFFTPLHPLFQGFLFIFIILIGITISIRIRRPILQGLAILVGSLGIISCVTLLLTLHYKVSLSLYLFPFLFSSLTILLYRYTQTEKKNTFIKELFGQYVNPKLLATILKENTLRLGGEKKYLTVLFSDIRGFTEMTEKMDAEELVRTLNHYFETMSPIIMKEDGVIDKYIGDAIMAFWNAPVAVLNHEEKAVHASLAMVKALGKMNEEKNTTLRIGIGLHAGEAIVGNIGSSSRINYTIIGDTVNACSRLEGLTKKYGVEILVSEQVKEKIHNNGSIIFRSIDIVRVKGKKEVMKLYQPLHHNEMQKEVLENHERAFSLYIQGDFENAKKLYKNGNDSHSLIMIKRLDEIEKNDKNSWSGVYDWDEK